MNNPETQPSQGSIDNNVKKYKKYSYKLKTKIIPIVLLFGLLGACDNPTTQIADNTFVYKDGVYKIVDNELTQIAEMNSNKVLKPTKQDLGTASLSYISANATSKLEALYRGNTLFFKLYINGLTDLGNNFTSGSFTINFMDGFGFNLHQAEIATYELTGVVGEDNKPLYYIYNGKTEMSKEIHHAIVSYSVSSTIKPTK